MNGRFARVHVAPDDGHYMRSRLRLERDDSQDMFALLDERVLASKATDVDARNLKNQGIVHLDPVSARWLRDTLTEMLYESTAVRGTGGQSTQVGSVVLTTMASGNLHIKTVHGGHVGSWEGQHVIERADRDDLLVALAIHLKAERGE